jgi:nucleoside 2-deoxyribosyltransferase
VRIDKEHVSGLIDDHMLAMIRQSGLLVADFTGQRDGVYFEAGFAMGLDVSVIRTVREDWFKPDTAKEPDKRGVHFDVEHYSFIQWKDPADLYQKLGERVEALYPRVRRKPLPRPAEG